MSLVWIDLETTGLHADRDHVLEIGCVVTDDKLREVSRLHLVVHHPRAHIFAALDPADEEAIAAAAQEHGIDPYVIKMHLANGLWAESAVSTLHPSGPMRGKQMSADGELSYFLVGIGGHTDERTGPQLAGSTVSFDRSFLKVHMPESHKLLHYRNLDTTSLNELARRVWPELHSARPTEVKGHRATTDIEYSIAIAKYYAGALEPKSEPVKAVTAAYGQTMVEVETKP